MNNYKRIILLLFINIVLFYKAQSAFAASLRWSMSRPINGMTCTQISEPSDPDYWQDNFLCSPVDISLRYSYKGPIAGMKCIKINEPDAGPVWSDNFLCHSFALHMDIRWSYN